MKCPFCGSEDLIVVNIRRTYGGYSNWRRRKCVQCSGVFTTYEKIDLNYVVVIKRDGRRERYSHYKLFGSIYNSFSKIKDFDSGDMAKMAEESIREVERRIVEDKRKEISTMELFELVLSILLESDIRVGLNYFAYSSKQKKSKDLQNVFRSLFS